MSFRLDHIVIAVDDLDQAFADYGRLGFTVVRGGEHANGVTHNVLVVLEDGAYLELISWKRPEPGNRWSDVYHAAGEGFLDHALLPADIVADVRAAQGRGLDMADPMPGGRLRPDGERLDWKTARSPGSDVPFLCGDVTPRRLRVQEGDVRHHPNGVTGVAEIVIAVHDAARSAGRYAALLGPATQPGVRDGEIGGSPVLLGTLRLASGTAVTLASPAGTDGPLAGALAAREEGPFSVVFQAVKAAELDAAFSHGARLSTTGRQG